MFLYKAPITFDVSVREIFLPIAIGATLVIAEPGRHGDPVHLADLIRRHGVTVIHFVPAMLAAFNEVLGAGVGELTSLRLIQTGGGGPDTTGRSRPDGAVARDAAPESIWAGRGLDRRDDSSGDTGRPGDPDRNPDSSGVGARSRRGIARSPPSVSRASCTWAVSSWPVAMPGGRI